ncbi:MAG: hypothetical protein D8M59_14130 [Planctomycetes bacterium]|nr:hypothetical protein [Planctomycetota bacterium]
MTALASAASAQVVDVDVKDSSFAPMDVGIAVNDTVRWTWSGIFPHSTTSAGGFAESWDSGIQSTGATFDYTFTAPGIYPYYCIIHGFDNGDGTVSGMSGHVSVFGTSTLELLGPVPGTAGKSNKFSAGNAPGNATVYFVYAFSTGSTPVPGCGGVTLDLRGPTLFATEKADANGFATFSVNVPNAAAGRTIYFQAVTTANCDVSNVVKNTF